MLKSNLLKKILVTAAFTVALPVAAQIDTTWDLDNGAKNTNSSLFDSLSISDVLNGNNLTITGWSNTGNGNTIEAGKLKYSNSYGLMLKNNNEGDTTPDHSIDSFNTYFDMVLLTFTKEVDLTRFDLGWARESSNLSRADISVAAFTGNGNAGIAGNTWGGVANSGNWSTVGHYLDVNSYSYQGVTSDVKSKYWLIGAYNPTFFNAGEVTGTYASANNDGFKLASVQGVTSSTKPPGGDIPEPSSIAILGLGMFALFFSRRRQQG